MTHKSLNLTRAANGALLAGWVDCKTSRAMQVVLWQMYINNACKSLADKRANEFLPKLTDEYVRNAK